jgi:hypothetical protein
MRRDWAVGACKGGIGRRFARQADCQVAVHGPALTKALPHDDRHRNRLPRRPRVTVGAGSGPEQRAEGECGD